MKKWLFIKIIVGIAIFLTVFMFAMYLGYSLIDEDYASEQTFHWLDKLSDNQQAVEYRLDKDSGEIVEIYGDFQRVLFTNAGKVVEVQAGPESKTIHFLSQNEDGYSVGCYDIKAPLQPVSSADVDHYSRVGKSIPTYLPPYDFESNILPTCRSGYHVINDRPYFVYAIKSSCNYPNGGVVIHDFLSNKDYNFSFSGEDDIFWEIFDNQFYYSEDEVVITGYTNSLYSEVYYPDDIALSKDMKATLLFGNKIVIIDFGATPAILMTTYDLTEDFNIDAIGCGGPSLDGSLESPFLVLNNAEYCEGRDQVGIIDLSAETPKINTQVNVSSNRDNRISNDFQPDKLITKVVRYRDVTNEFSFADAFDCSQEVGEEGDRKYSTLVKEKYPDYDSYCYVCGVVSGCFVGDNVKTFEYSSTGIVVN